MPYVESTRGRRIIGRMDHGDSITDVLLDACSKAGVSAGMIRMQGILSAVELAVFDSDNGEYVPSFSANGDLELISVQGNISLMGPKAILNTHVTIAYMEHGQNRVVGGQLRAATAYSVEYVIEAFDDVTIERTMDPDTKLPTWNRLEAVEQAEQPAKTSPMRVAESGEPTKPLKPQQNKQTIEASATMDRTAPKTKPAMKRPTVDDWKAAADKAQEKLERPRSRPSSIEESGDFEIIELVPGDTLLHPRLGECKVVRVEDDVAAYIRLPKSRRISKLALDLVRLEWVELRDKNNVYKVHAAGR